MKPTRLISPPGTYFVNFTTFQRRRFFVVDSYNSQRGTIRKYSREGYDFQSYRIRLGGRPRLQPLGADGDETYPTDLSSRNVFRKLHNLSAPTILRRGFVQFPKSNHLENTPTGKGTTSSRTALGWERNLGFSR
jgi:hypothetical protein